MRGDAGGSRIVAVDAHARREGAREGMTLAEARAHAPSLATAVFEPSRLEALEAFVTDALLAISPRLGRSHDGHQHVGDLRRSGGDDFLVEVVSPSDVERLAHLVHELDLGPATLGVADGAFASICAARTIEARVAAGAAQLTSAPRRQIVPRGQDAGFLAPLSSTLLPASEAARDAIASLGLHNMALVAALPLEGVQARLGEEGRFLVALARGAAMPSLATYVPQSEPTTEVDLVDGLAPPSGSDDTPDTPDVVGISAFGSDPTSDGATTLDAVLFALRAACMRLLPSLAARGQGVGEAEVTLDCGARHPPTRLVVRPARPELDPNALFELARATLESASHSHEIPPVARLRLTATVLVPIEHNGERLAFARREANILPLDVTLARLRGRFGTDRVVTPVRHEDPRPDGRGTFQVANGNNVAERASSKASATIELRERLRTPSPAIGAVILSRAPAPGDPWPVRTIGHEGTRRHKRTVEEVGPPERIVGGWWETPYELVYRWVVASDGTRALFTCADRGNGENGGWRLVGLAD